MIFVIAEYQLLIRRFELDVACIRTFCSHSVLSSVFLQHVFLDALGESDRVSAARLLKVSQVGDVVSFGGLLLCELVRIHIPLLFQVLVECGLSGHLPGIDLLRPERMLAKMLPRDSLDRVLLEKSAKQVSEQSAGTCNWLKGARLDLRDQLL